MMKSDDAPLQAGTRTACNQDNATLEQTIALFRDGRVSASMAARLAGLPLTEMLTRLSRRGIPFTGTEDPAEEELLAEMRQARAWAQQASTR